MKKNSNLSPEDIEYNKIKKTALEKLTLGKLKLMCTNRFFSSVLIHFYEEAIEREECKAFPTIGVNAHGRIKFNPIFINSLELDMLIGILCHEALHVIFLHLVRYPEKNFFNFEIWNIATDAVINNILINHENMSLPPNGIIPNRNSKLTLDIENSIDKLEIEIKDKPAETVYYEIINQLKKKGLFSKIPFGNLTNNEKQNSNIFQDQGIDNHTLEVKENGENLSQEDQQKISKNWSAIVKNAIMQSSNGRDTSSNWVKRAFEDLLKPQLDWRSILRSKIKAVLPYNYSYRTPAKRSFVTKIYTPSIYKKPEEIIVAIDVSGSISEEELNTFISEIYGIIRSYENLTVRVLFWSTHVDEKNDIRLKPSTFKNVLNIVPNSTGGTEISCVKQYLKNNTNQFRDNTLIIFITDGFVENDPDLCKHSLFVISQTGKTDILEKYGYCVRLKR